MVATSYLDSPVQSYEGSRIALPIHHFQIMKWPEHNPVSLGVSGLLLVGLPGFGAVGPVPQKLLHHLEF